MKKILFSLFAIALTLQLNAQTGLKVGDKASSFIVKDNNGKTLDLKALLKQHKSVVLFFYRGQWCPYCNKHIKELQDSLQLLTAKGAYVIGVTPETETSVIKTKEKTKASFSIISDRGYKIMKAYKVDFVMEPGLVEKYKGYGIDVAGNNGDSQSVLPVPATYIIGKNGLIKYVQFDKNYQKRATVKMILEKLK
jgi:peroxiredoxin